MYSYCNCILDYLFTNNATFTGFYFLFKLNKKKYYYYCCSSSSFANLWISTSKYISNPPTTDFRIFNLI